MHVLLAFLKCLLFSSLVLALSGSVLARETVADAAQISRRLVDLAAEAVATMATVFPPDHPSSAGQPFSLQEYYASCHSNGSLTLLFLPISRHSQNIIHSPTHAASISVSSEHPTASRPRVSLIGNVTVFQNLDETPNKDAIQSCYVSKHPDARWWLPGPREPHVAYWARFDPHTIYFVGGFGDRHYIGYIPLDLYQNAIPSQEVQHLQIQDNGHYVEDSAYY